MKQPITVLIRPALVDDIHELYPGLVELVPAPEPNMSAQVVVKSEGQRLALRNALIRIAALHRTESLEYGVSNRSAYQRHRRRAKDAEDVILELERGYGCVL